MSYQVALQIDTGGRQPHTVAEIGDGITTNLKPMLSLAGIDLPSLDGLVAGDCVMRVTEAIRQLEIDPERFDAVAPANGWGCFLNVQEFLEALLRDLLAHPKTTLVVSW